VFLIKRPTTTPTADARLRRMIVGYKSTTSELLADKIKYGDYYGELYTTTQYVWETGHAFFDTTTEHLRQMQGPAITATH
jgi:hypothetical protein